MSSFFVAGRNPILVGGPGSLPLQVVASVCAFLLLQGCMVQAPAADKTGERSQELWERYQSAQRGDVTPDDRSPRVVLGISVGRDLTEELLDQVLLSDEAYIVLIGTDTCTASLRFTPFFEAAIRESDLEGRVLLAHLGGGSFELVRPLIERPLVVPSILVIRRGEVVDLQMGTETDDEFYRTSLRNLFVRNGLLEGEVEMVYEFLDHSDKAVFDFVRRRAGLHSADLSGRDLSGLQLARGSFAGSSLRGTNLSDASLRNMVFSYVDLTGANVSGADFTGALLRHAICPDGTLSEMNGGVCEFD